MNFSSSSTCLQRIAERGQAHSGADTRFYLSSKLWISGLSGLGSYFRNAASGDQQSP